MVLTAWFPSGAALSSCHECALSQVDTRPDKILGHKTRTKNKLLVNLEGKFVIVSGMHKSLTPLTSISTSIVAFEHGYAIDLHKYQHVLF